MSYVVRKSGQKSFKVQNQVSKNGIRRAIGIGRSLWPQLGFSHLMTLEEAKARATILNEEKSKDKLSLVKAAKNEATITKINTIYVPPEYANGFEKWLSDNWATKAQARLMIHWRVVQKLVNSLQLLPKDFHRNTNQIVNYLAKEEYSPSYSDKIIRIMNYWLDYVGDKQGQTFNLVRRLKGTKASTIADAYLESVGYRGPSDPLTPALLTKIKSNITVPQYKFLCFTVWFGLRPEEVRKLQNKNFSAYIKHDDELKLDVLWIYQTKLKGITEHKKRWKGIPAFLPEQKTTLTYLADEIIPPLNKTLKKYLEGRVTLYSGRKGFVDLMLDKNQTLENISSWMGHASIDMTWIKYRNKKRVSFTPTG